MPLRIIDNKRIDLTDSEYTLYQEICKSNDRPNFRGEDLFQNLFETSSDGLIIFLRSPTAQFSFEVVLFLLNVMTNQHMRKIYKEHYEALDELKKLMKDATEILNKVQSFSSSEPKTE